MKWGMKIAFFVVLVCSAAMAMAQTQKALTNSEIVTMKEGFDSNLIVKEIQASATDFDVSLQALIELKNAGVTQSVMEAMLTAAQTNKPVRDVCCGMARKFL